jgi:uncharacterized protein (TIGR00730 family)
MSDAPTPETPIRRICIFCGASPGREPRYAALAAETGDALARRGIGIVYGGGRVGLMGALADSALAADGEVIGVIPRGLVERELAHPGLTELRVVETLHERKALMADLSDAFIALPGGLGTLEELSEVVSWAQLGLHSKPFGVLDSFGYFDDLLRFLDHAVGEGFLAPRDRAASWPSRASIGFSSASPTPSASRVAGSESDAGRSISLPVTARRLTCDARQPPCVPRDDLSLHPALTPLCNRIRVGRLFVRDPGTATMPSDRRSGNACCTGSAAHPETIAEEGAGDVARDPRQCRRIVRRRRACPSDRLLRPQALVREGRRPLGAEGPQGPIRPSCPEGRRTSAPG